jgi:5-methylcytosine-specific restriction enzyme A
MSLLYYWRSDNYYRDLDMGAGFHLNQANPLLHRIDIGDSLWAFTRNREGAYVLAVELVVKAKTENPPNFRYGRYRLWGDINLSRYFQTDGQPSIELIIRSLSCTANARILGQSFQGYAAVKSITQEDSNILRAAAQDLPLEPLARILPEERLEATLLLGDPDAVERLVTEEQPGMAIKRRRYLYTQAPTRNPKLAEEIQEMYEGRCQICLWHPREQYQVRLCHVHHIQWLSRGGEDALDNLALVCPNHHSAIHRVDAPLDYRDMAFDFGTHRENILLNSHLGVQV